MTFELGFTCHRFQIPNLESIFINWSYWFCFVAVTDGALLWQFENNTFKSINIPNSKCFIICNSYERITIFCKLDQPNDIQMSLYPLKLSTCLGIRNNEIVATTEGKFPTIDWNRASGRGKLNLVFFGEDIYLVHACSIKDTRNHLWLIHNGLLKISTSKRTLIKNWVWQVCKRYYHIIEIQIRKDIAYLVK